MCSCTRLGLKVMPCLDVLACSHFLGYADGGIHLQLCMGNHNEYGKYRVCSDSLPC